MLCLSTEYDDGVGVGEEYGFWEDVGAFGGAVTRLYDSVDDYGECGDVLDAWFVDEWIDRWY